MVGNARPMESKRNRICFCGRLLILKSYIFSLRVRAPSILLSNIENKSEDNIAG